MRSDHVRNPRIHQSDQDDLEYFLSDPLGLLDADSKTVLRVLGHMIQPAEPHVYRNKREWELILIYLLTHSNLALRVSASELIGHLKLKAAWRPLCGLALSDSALLSRLEAIDALSTLEVRRSCRSLKVVVERDPHWAARGRAMQAISLILGRPALPWMEEAYAKERHALARRWMSLVFLSLGDVSKCAEGIRTSKRMRSWYLPDYVDSLRSFVTGNGELTHELAKDIRDLITSADLDE